jgi:hypothetical protein
MDTNETTQLSVDVLRALQEKFSGDEREQVARLLSELHWKYPSETERIHLDILHAASDVERVSKLAALAKKDWRDLIVATEYEVREGKLVRTAWSLEMARQRQRRSDEAAPTMTPWHPETPDE